MPKAAKKSTPSTSSSSPLGMSCSNEWWITGYYTPSEDMFSGLHTTINVPGHGTDHFPTAFLHVVNVEGWGQTRHGWFLGWDHGWHKNSAPLNARGGPLQIGSLAVDRHLISFGTRVQIVTLPPPWNQQQFVADDTGGGIHGKHLDVYCGAGSAARDETYRITHHGGRACLA